MSGRASSAKKGEGRSVVELKGIFNRTEEGGEGYWPRMPSKWSLWTTCSASSPVSRGEMIRKAEQSVGRCPIFGGVEE